MRAFAIVALCLLAVSAVSAQQNLTAQVFIGSNACNQVVANSNITAVHNTSVTPFVAGKCSFVTFEDGTTLNFTATCNNAAGVISLWVFDNANCTGGNSSDVATFQNNVCGGEGKDGTASAIFTGCPIIAPAPSSSSSSTGSSNTNGTVVSSTNTNPNTTVISSTNSAPNTTVISSSSVTVISSSSTGVSPNGTTPTPAPKGSSSSTGPQGSAAQAAVSMFALAASVVVALL